MKVSLQAALFPLGYLLQPCCNLLECLPKDFEELGVGLGGTAHRGIHLELASEPSGVPDVISGWFHGRRREDVMT